jgi:hypothetical protein
MTQVYFHCSNPKKVFADRRGAMVDDLAEARKRDTRGRAPNVRQRQLADAVVCLCAGDAGSPGGCRTDQVCMQPVDCQMYDMGTRQVACRAWGKRASFGLYRLLLRMSCGWRALHHQARAASNPTLNPTLQFAQHELADNIHAGVTVVETRNC